MNTLQKYILLSPDDNSSMYQKNKGLFKFLTKQKLYKTDFSILSSLKNCNSFLYGLIYLSTFQNPDSSDFIELFNYNKTALPVLAAATSYDIQNDTEYELFCLALALKGSCNVSNAVLNNIDLCTRVIDNSEKISYSSDSCVWARYVSACAVLSALDSDEKISHNTHLFIQAMSLVSNLEDEFNSIMERYPLVNQKGGFDERIKMREH